MRPDIENYKDYPFLIEDVDDLSLGGVEEAALKIPANDRKKKIEQLVEFISSNDGDLKNLYLVDCQLDDEDIVRIAEALARNTTITDFGIINNNIGKEAIIALGKNIVQNESIGWLSLENSKIDEEGIDEFHRDIVGRKSIIIIQGKGSNLRDKINEITVELQSIKDAVEDYAKTLLLPRVVKAFESEDGLKKVREHLEVDLLRLATDLTRKCLFQDSNCEEIRELSTKWHSPLCQEKTLKLRDYEGCRWLPLFGAKEVAIPVEIVGENGWKLIARIDPSELKIEGRNLKHCVGGYSGKCVTGDTHIISVTDSSGKSVSTIEFELNYSEKTFEVKQHRGARNSDPSEQSQKVLKWLQDQIASGEIKIDYEALDAAKESRIVAHGLEVMVIGFNPFDAVKCREALRVFKKEIIPDRLKQNLAALLAVSVMDCTSLKGFGVIALPPLVEEKVKVAPTISAEKSAANKAKKEEEEKGIIPTIKGYLDSEFGEDQFKVSTVALVDGTRRVFIEGENIAELQKRLKLIRAFQRDGVLVEQEGGILIFGINPKPVKNIFEKNFGAAVGGEEKPGNAPNPQSAAAAGLAGEVEGRERK